MTDEDVSSFSLVLHLGDIFLELLFLQCQDQFPHLYPEAYSSGYDKSKCYKFYKNYILGSSFSQLFLFGAREVDKVKRNSQTWKKGGRETARSTLVLAGPKLK